MLDIQTFKIQQEEASDNMFRAYFHVVNTTESSFKIGEINKKISDLKKIREDLKAFNELCMKERAPFLVDVLHLDIKSEDLPLKTSSLSQILDLEVPLCQPDRTFGDIHTQIRKSMSMVEHRARSGKIAEFVARFIEGFEFLFMPYFIMKNAQRAFKLPDDQTVFMPRKALTFFASTCLKKMTMDIQELLAHGGYGSISSITIMGKLYAQKTIHPQARGEQYRKNVFYTEVAMNMLIPRSPHLLSIAALHEDKMFLEFGGSKTLYDVYRQESLLAPVEISRYFLSLAKGLASLHNVGFNHNDLKPTNILLNHETGEIKLADFGLSRPTHLSRNCIRTLSYAPPELFDDSHQITTAADIWAFGISLHQLLTKASITELPEMPFPEMVQMAKKMLTPLYMRKVVYEELFNFEDVETHYFFKKQDPKGFLQRLVLACLHGDPRKRPSAPEIVEHLKAIVEAYS